MLHAVASALFGLAAIGVTATVSRLILSFPIGLVMGLGDTIATNFPRATGQSFATVVLIASFSLWALLSLGLSVQLGQALSVPRWAFWVCAAIVASLPIYLHQQKLQTFGPTAGDNAISIASIALIAVYLALVFTPMRVFWLTLLGVFEN